MIIGLVKVNAAKMTSDLTNVNVGATFNVTINNPNSNSDYKINFDEKYIKISSDNTCGSVRNVLVSSMPCVIKFEVEKKLQLIWKQLIVITDNCKVFEVPNIELASATI